MRGLTTAALIGGVFLSLGLPTVRAAQGQQGQQTTAPNTPVVASNAPGPDRFNGVWDYNAEQSVDAATGRKEQNPRTSQRRGANTSALAGPSGPIYSGPTSGMPYPGYAGGTMPGMVFVNELRELTRDLLEVPEQLTIAVSSDGVTFTDDLERARTYPADSRRHKYQLGAAVFHAKAEWDGHEFKKEIEGGDGQFKLRETYFLSEDGQRLFVVLRVGDPPREGRDGQTRINGYNRVYDRVAK
jgi:hypothetical protein